MKRREATSALDPVAGFCGFVTVIIMHIILWFTGVIR